MKSLADRATLALLLLWAIGILLVMMVPNTMLSWLRSEYRWLGQSVNWVEALWPGWDTVHILLFGVFATLARLALPNVRALKLLVSIAVFSAASEILQFWAIGRRPSLSDFAQDVLGALAGLLFVWVLKTAWRSSNTKAIA